MLIERIYEKRKHTDIKENRAGVIMGIIPVVGFLVFGLIPIILGVVMSFFDFHGKQFFDSDTTWAGFKNYQLIFNRDPKTGFKDNGLFFVETLLNTLMMYLSVPVCIILSLIVAFFLSKKIKCKTLFRTIFLLPFVCSSIAVTFIWGRVFNVQYGLLNQVLIHVLGASPAKYQAFNWGQQYFYWVLLIINVWGGCGFNIILYTAALTNVNNSYYEAAQVDGANPFQIFFKITLPAISPTTFYLFITATIGAFQAFAIPDMMRSFTGAVAGEVFGVFINDQNLTVIGYMQHLLDIQPGIASSMAVVLTLIIAVVTIINFIGQKFWVSYD